MIDISPSASVPMLGAFAKLARGSRLALLGSVAFGLAAGAGSTGLLVYINMTLAQAADRARPTTAALFVGLCLLVLLAGIASEVLILRLTQSNVLQLRLWLCGSILSAPFEKLQSCGIPRLMAALTDDIANIAHAYEVLPVLLIEGSIALGALIYVGYLSPVLLVILLSLLAIGVTGFFIAQGWALRWLRLAREAEDTLFGHFRALTEGFKELKMNARRRHELLDDELRPTANLIRMCSNAGLTGFIVGSHSGKILFFVAIGIVLFIPISLTDIPAEVMTGWTLSILFIMGPVSTIVHIFAPLGQGLVAMQKIEALGFALSEDAVKIDRCELAQSAQRPSVLELVGVSFCYRSESDGSEFELGPLDLRIEPGELVFVTGGNGNGKTTLAFLLLGLLSPENGQIELDGKPVTEDQRDIYRQNFAAVFADAFVFESLLGYRDQKSGARAEALLRKFHLDHKVSVKNGTFSTVELSRGQRKRLALLTAFIEDRPFYLFDELAADQDPVFRDLFYIKILPELKARGKTVIVITHDDRYFHLADRLLRLDMGLLHESLGMASCTARRAHSFEARPPT